MPAHFLAKLNSDIADFELAMNHQLNQGDEVAILECADLSALCYAATWRSRKLLATLAERLLSPAEALRSTSSFPAPSFSEPTLAGGINSEVQDILCNDRCMAHMIQKY